MHNIPAPNLSDTMTATTAGAEVPSLDLRADTVESCPTMVIDYELIKKVRSADPVCRLTLDGFMATSSHDIGLTNPPYKLARPVNGFWGTLLLDSQPFCRVHYDTDEECVYYRPLPDRVETLPIAVQISQLGASLRYSLRQQGRSPLSTIDELVVYAFHEHLMINAAHVWLRYYRVLCTADGALVTLPKATPEDVIAEREQYLSHIELAPDSGPEEIAAILRQRLRSNLTHGTSL